MLSSPAALSRTIELQTLTSENLLTIWCTGGSLGWKTKGSLMPEFEKVAFELEASTTGSPKWGEAKTSEGKPYTPPSQVHDN